MSEVVRQIEHCYFRCGQGLLSSYIKYIYINVSSLSLLYHLYFGMSARGFLVLLNKEADKTFRYQHSILILLKMASLKSSSSISHTVIWFLAYLELIFSVKLEDIIIQAPNSKLNFSA